MNACTSLPQLCLLGPPPPRMPGRADPQVPANFPDAPVKYGRIPHLYFYVDGQGNDAAYGLLDIELALHALPHGLAFELYCIGDGYQSGTGIASAPLVIEIRSAAHVMNRVSWRYPDILGGNSDPMHFSATLALPSADFSLVDHILIPPAKGQVR